MLTGVIYRLFEPAVLRALCRCPPPLTYAGLSLLGRLRYRLWRRRRRAVENRITALVGPLPSDRLDRVVETLFVNALQDRVRELPLSSLGDEALAQFVTIEGMEHVDSALRDGTGGLLLGTRVGSPYMICYVLRRMRYPLVRAGRPGVVTRRLDAEVYPGLERALGTVFDDIFLAKGRDSGRLALQLKRMHSVLRSNRLLFVRADGGSVTRPVEVPFFGRDVGFPPGWVSLARLTGAPAMPVFMVREGRAGAVRIQIHSPISRKLIEAPDPAAPVAAYAEALEAHVRRHPCNAGGLATSGRGK